MALALLSTKYINRDRYAEAIDILAKTETLACFGFFFVSVMSFHPANKSKNIEFFSSTQTGVVMSVVSAIFLSMNLYCRRVLELHNYKIMMVKELEDIHVDNTKIAKSLDCVSLSERIQEAVVKSK